VVHLHLQVCPEAQSKLLVGVAVRRQMIRARRTKCHARMSNRRASHDLAETFALALALCWDCERS